MKAIIKTKPVSKARPRVTRYGTYTPKKTLDYEKLIRTEFIKQCGGKYIPKYEGAVSIKIIFNIEVPKSYSKKKRAELIDTPCTKKPDIDNLVKAVLDSLNGIAFKDDNQVYILIAIKRYMEEDSIEIELDYVEGNNE